MFIDNSNLFHALRGGGHPKMDYIALRDALADGRQIDVRFYYSEPPGEDAGSPSRDRFYGFLENTLGYLMVKLPLRQRSGFDPITKNLVKMLKTLGAVDDDILEVVSQPPRWLRQIDGQESVSEEKGLDCEIVYDMANLARQGCYSSFILVAGDEDYARTLKRLKVEIGIGVELAFFGGARCSKILQKEADVFVDLNNIPNLFRSEISSDEGSRTSSKEGAECLREQHKESRYARIVTEGN